MTFSDAQRGDEEVARRRRKQTMKRPYRKGTTRKITENK
jgi:hypothetical protein